MTSKASRRYDRQNGWKRFVEVLREIRIKNYAIIDDLSLAFFKGFSAITGETGAGKSLLVEALALLLGEQGRSQGPSDSKWIRHETDEAILEGRFDPPSSSHPSEPLILKRALSRSGSRAYVNGSRTRLQTLQETGTSLAEIYGQHDHHRLVRPASLLSFLDAYAALLTDRQFYQAAYQKRSHLQSERLSLQNTLTEKEREEALLRQQLSDIDAANLQPEEEASLEQEERSLKYGAAILSSTEEGYALLSDGGGILSQLKALQSHVANLREVAKDAEPEMALLESAALELKELALLLRHRMGQITLDPDRQRVVTERLYLIQKMKRKYGASIPEILQCRDGLESALHRLLERAKRLSEVEQALQEATAGLHEKAERLSAARRLAIDRFQERVKVELSDLKMDQTRFEISCQKKPFSEDGADAVDFLIALPGEPFKPMAEVASGGELSRLMLALKVVLADIDPTPTFFFDEIDAGIGGAVAECIGRRLSRLSQRHQVFCITHLPQIARFADHHYVVTKKMSGKRVIASVKSLTPKERVSELARMLGGLQTTAVTRRHAEELVKTEP